MIQALANEMIIREIAPELESFDSGMVNYAKYLERKEMIKAPHYFNLIFGNIACAQADLLHTGIMIRDLPDHSIWSIGAVGDSQLMMNSIAVSMGYGVRVGIEDNIWYDPSRTKLARNIDLVRRIHTLAETNDREIMTPLELRVILSLQPGNGKYGRTYKTSDINRIDQTIDLE
jgi:uncharacterized protein (DUF849 family)